jgi:hypothetical protein
LEEERDVTLACLAICKATYVRVNKAHKDITKETEEHRKTISRDDIPIVSSLSDLVGNRYY